LGAGVTEGRRSSCLVVPSDYNHRMIAVGIRELKGRLSAYLRRVRDGEVVQVTDRGVVVAELRKPVLPTGPTSHGGVNRLILEGAAHLERTDPPDDLYAAPARPGLPRDVVLALLNESRGDR